MLSYRGNALGFAAASWQWQPSPHDPSNVIEVEDVLAALNADLNASEAADTLSADGSSSAAGINGSASLTEGADTLASAAVLAIQATLARTESADTVTAAGALAIQATASLTEGADTLAATGSVSSTAINGDLTATEAPDTLSADATIAAAAVATSSYWNQYREPDKEEIKRAVKIGPADPKPAYRPSPRVRRVEKQNRQTLNRIAAAELASKQARGARLRQIALADDDWLMTM